jgi:catechol 2,3-dioxygenase-like lactoylglutathione lyase family enzyme
MYHYYMTTFPSVTHLAVTVSDLDQSVAWYETLFGSAPFFIGDESAYRFAVWLEPVFGLHQHHGESSDGEAFDEHRIGLDHIAFGCASRGELEIWLERLEELRIEHGEIVDAFYGSGLAFRDPDNIQLEFFVQAVL